MKKAHMHFSISITPARQQNIQYKSSFSVNLISFHLKPLTLETNAIRKLLHTQMYAVYVLYSKWLYKGQGYSKGQSPAILDALTDIVFAQRQQCVTLSITTREDNIAEKMGMEGRDEPEIWIRSWVRDCVCMWVCVYVCVCVCVCGCAVFAVTQRQCGSVLVHNHGTCQAGSNVGQAPRGFSYPVVSLTLALCLSFTLSWRVPRGPATSSAITNHKRNSNHH